MKDHTFHNHLALALKISYLKQNTNKAKIKLLTSVDTGSTIGID